MSLPSSLRDALAVLGGTYEERGLDALRVGVAVLGVLALLYEALRESQRRPLSVAVRRRGAVVLGALGMVCYFQFFTFGYAPLIHRSEQFHYYVGSKYFPELGYEDLYRCTLVAAAERGIAPPQKIRDLHTNTLRAAVPVPSAADGPLQGEHCRSRFTEARWNAFSNDIAFFREAAGPEYWQSILQDHGYNATPTWGLLGRAVGEAVPASLRGLQLVASTDLFLMAGCLVALWWGSGLRVACLGALFWGTQAASTFYWTGGSMLRQDWLFCCLAALALLRRGYPGLAGGSLAYAALARVFPGLLFLGGVLVAVRHWRRQGHFRTDHLRFFGGALALSLVLVPASVVVNGSGAWPAFARHIAMHDGTPTTNRMGWKGVVSHSAAGRMTVVTEPSRSDPYSKWKSLREERLHDLVWVYRAGFLLALGAFVCVTSRLRSFALAISLGACLLPVLLGLSCYYYSFLLLLCPLSRARRPLELAAVLAALLSGVAALKYPAFDDRYIAMSVLFLVYAGFTLLSLGRMQTAERGIAA